MWFYFSVLLSTWSVIFSLFLRKPKAIKPLAGILGQASIPHLGCLSHPPPQSPLLLPLQFENFTPFPFKTHVQVYDLLVDGGKEGRKACHFKNQLSCMLRMRKTAAFLIVVLFQDLWDCNFGLCCTERLFLGYTETPSQAPERLSSELKLLVLLRPGCGLEWNSPSCCSSNCWVGCSKLWQF